MNIVDNHKPQLVPLTASELVSAGVSSPLLWRPQYLEQSSWLEHIPFAFWLTAVLRPKVLVELGSYYGSSYFAFCQAVERLGLDTQCFAVDTWKGDEHAGFYEEQVYAKVKQYNDAQYSSFSRLVRTTFDDAVPHFLDGSIDLLHIDGFHTLDDVRHDFETWLPKLSERAVVIFHDSNVRERDFGVYRLMEALKQRYPSFEFLHGHGLGVVGVGSEQNDMLARLYLANDDPMLRPEIQELFSRMGRACADAFAATDQLKRADKFFAEVKKLRERTEELKTALEKARSDLGARAKTLAEKEASAKESAEKHTAERAQLRERASLFQDLYTGLKEEAAGLQLALRELAAERDRGQAEAVRLQEMTQSSQQQVQKFAQVVQERDARIQELKQQAAQVTILRQREAQLQEKLSAAESALAEHKQQLEQVQGRQRVLARQVETQQKELGERDTKIAGMESERGEARTRLEQVKQHAQKLAGQRDAVKAALDERIVQVAALEEQLRVWEQRVADMNARLQERDGQYAELQQRLEAQLQEAEQGLQRISTLESLVHESQMSLQLREQEFDERLQRIAVLETQVAELGNTLATAEQEVKAARRAAGASKELRDTVTAQGAEIKRLGEEKRELQSENEKLKSGVEQRFFELAELTRMLESATALAQSRSQENEVLRLQVRETEKLQRELLQKQQASLEATNAEHARREADVQQMVRRMVQAQAGAAQTEGSKPSGFRALLSFGSQASARHKTDRKLAEMARLVERSGLFDGEWYLQRYPDVRESQDDPLLHYLRHGGPEGRDPGPHFNASAYLRNYPDVLDSGLNPLVHYLKHGSGEGRNISSVDQ